MGSRGLEGLSQSIERFFVLVTLQRDDAEVRLSARDLIVPTPVVGEITVRLEALHCAREIRTHERNLPERVAGREDRAIARRRLCDDAVVEVLDQLRESLDRDVVITNRVSRVCSAEHGVQSKRRFGRVDHLVKASDRRIPFADPCEETTTTQHEASITGFNPVARLERCAKLAEVFKCEGEVELEVVSRFTPRMVEQRFDEASCLRVSPIATQSGDRTGSELQG